MALQLVDDIEQSMSGTGGSPVSYVLGSVILHSVNSDDGTAKTLDVVDGQQRLLTIRMIAMRLGGSTSFTPKVDSAAGQVWNALEERLGMMSPNEANELLDYLNNYCELVRIETDSADEAFRIFDSQNYRGRALVPHDLLKAHHLREMLTESESRQIAVVDRWESTDQKQLDRLFSEYLHPIIQWGRGEEAGILTPNEIDNFKGILRRDFLSPSDRYHLAASMGLQFLDSLATSSGIESQARVQIDAPVPAGEPFFEWVSHLNECLLVVAHKAFDDIERRNGVPVDIRRFASFEVDNEKSGSASQSSQGKLKEVKGKDRHRYRMTSWLYIAACLYFTTRFGKLEHSDRWLLFRWAFLPRIALQRVFKSSIEIHARGVRTGRLGEKISLPLFAVIRNARSVEDVRRKLSTPELSLIIRDIKTRDDVRRRESELLEVLGRGA